MESSDTIREQNEQLVNLDFHNLGGTKDDKTENNNTVLRSPSSTSNRKMCHRIKEKAGTHLGNEHSKSCIRRKKIQPRLAWVTTEGFSDDEDSCLTAEQLDGRWDFKVKKPDSLETNNDERWDIKVKKPDSLETNNDERWDIKVKKPDNLETINDERRWGFKIKKPDRLVTNNIGQCNELGKHFAECTSNKRKQMDLNIDQMDQRTVSNCYNKYDENVDKRKNIINKLDEVESFEECSKLNEKPSEVDRNESRPNEAFEKESNFKKYRIKHKVLNRVSKALREQKKLYSRATSSVTQLLSSKQKLKEAKKRSQKIGYCEDLPEETSTSKSSNTKKKIKMKQKLQNQLRALPQQFRQRTKTHADMTLTHIPAMRGPHITAMFAASSVKK